jgi:malic enzyme
MIEVVAGAIVMPKPNPKMASIKAVKQLVDGRVVATGSPD